MRFIRPGTFGFLTGFLSAVFLLGALAYTEQIQIDRTKVQAAQQILGLSFSDAKIDSMLDGLQANLVSFETIRALQIPNEIPPALYFNPIPPGQLINFAPDREIRWELHEVSLPDNKNDLAFYSILELAYLIRERLISATELTEFFLNRIETHGFELEAVITVTRERALAQARERDAELDQGIWRGPLHGIPYGAKDLLAVAEYKTTWGAVPFKDQIIDDTATVISKLDDAGAVLIAKLTLGALAWGDVWFGGVTRNPWNTEQGASGSSAGSGSATAAGLVPFSLGTETLGSIVSPSTRNGITGLRPTFGTVSRAGAMALSWSMDKIGPMTRSVEDAAVVFDAIRGPDGIDLNVFDATFPFDQNANISTLRIGYLANAFESDYAYKEQDQEVLQTLRTMGIELIPVSLPDFPIGAMNTILSAEAATAFDQLTLTNQDDLMVRQVRNAWPNVFRTARFTPAVEYLQANRARTMYMKKFQRIFDDVDVFLSPSFVGGTLLATNLTGHPAIVVKNGYDANGSPTSITFIGNLFQEANLAHVAQAWQRATAFHLQHPPGF